MRDMPLRVAVKPELLRWARERWARERSRIDDDDLQRRFPQLDKWERGSIQPTLKQLEAFAKATHAPVGYLFLSEPPVETIPLPDFRTMGAAQIERPSPNLLDMIYICQQRQEWYREYAKSIGEAPLDFVGSASLNDDIAATAARISATLNFPLEERHQARTWTDALHRFIEQADEVGVLVMRSGVVLNNNNRKLDAREFRGFAIPDGHAPLIFINGADTKAGQMFTLAHELAHIWLGQSSLDNAEASQVEGTDVERWCNEVAAELLVPIESLRQELQTGFDLNTDKSRLARSFKVSTLVILRRFYDAGFLSHEQLQAAYRQELEHIGAITGSTGGDFYHTQGARLSKRFARALIVSTLEGQTLYRDAFRMLGVSKYSTFQELGRSLGVLA